MSDSEQSEVELIADKDEDLDLPKSTFKLQRSFVLKNSRFSPIARPETSEMPNNSNVPQNLGLPPPPQIPVAPAQNTNTANSNMLDKSEINLLMNAIPEYYPGNSLSIFINEVDYLVRHLQGRLSNDLAYVVSFSIRSKIKGEARDLIAFQNANDWPDIKRALLNKYGDQRSEELLESALRQTIQNKNESYVEFYGRVLKAHSELMQHISLYATETNFFDYRKNECEKLALKTFQIGLLEPYRSYVSNFEIRSIEECLNKCRFFDNRKQEWEYCEFLRRNATGQTKNFNNKTQPSKFNNPSWPLPNFARSINPVNAHAHQNASHQNFYANSNFNRNNQSTSQSQIRKFGGDINKPIPQSSRFPTNRQVFGTKPGTNISRLHNQPTPMSIQSRVNTHQFRSNFGPRPPVIHEELNHTEIENNPSLSDENTEQPCYDFSDFSENDYDNYEENFHDEQNFQIEASESQQLI